MTLCERCGNYPNICGCAEADALEAQLAEETAIVDRIWDIYGRPSYESLQGRSLYDLINADRARLAEAEARIARLLEITESCESCFLDARATVSAELVQK